MKVEGRYSIFLKGSWQNILRWLALVLVLLALGLYFAGIPYKFVEIQVPCQLIPATQCDGSLLTPEQARILQAAGISTKVWADYELTIYTISTITITCLAFLIFWRKPEDWFAVILMIALMTFNTDYTTLALARAHPVWFPLVNWLSNIGSTLFPVIFFLFPDGHFVPRWTRYLVAAWLLIGLVSFIYSPEGLTNILIIGTWIAMLIGSIIAQVYRYRYVSTPSQRQQIKWIVFFLAIIVLMLLPINLILELLSQSNQSSLFVILNLFINRFIGLLLGVGLPLVFGIAILRYRLWDIDVIIRRTLVYSMLSLTLALIYFGCVLLLQEIFQALTGQSQSPVITVISTLAIAALFAPLRKRIQNDIDRHFYRRKYDAEKVLQAFAASLRNEVDLDEMSNRLLMVVRETVQPEDVSLWLQKYPIPQGTKSSNTAEIKRVEAGNTTPYTQ